MLSFDNLYPIPNPNSTTRRLTVDATAGGVAFGAIIVADPLNLVWFDVQTAGVYVTIDGATAPTTSVGHYLPINTNYTVNSVLAAKMKFIREAAVSAAIQYTELLGRG